MCRHWSCNRLYRINWDCCIGISGSAVYTHRCIVANAIRYVPLAHESPHIRVIDAICCSSICGICAERRSFARALISESGKQFRHYMQPLLSVRHCCGKRRVEDFHWPLSFSPEPSSRRKGAAAWARPDHNGPSPGWQKAAKRSSLVVTFHFNLLN